MDETRTADRAAVDQDARRRVQMPGNEAGSPASRFMREHQIAPGEVTAALAAEGMRRRIMIAAQPDPASPTGEQCKRRAITLEQARGSLVAMKAVTEGNDSLRAGPEQVAGEASERQPSIVGRQQLAAAGIGGEFFEMEVGDQQRAFGRPIKRARGKRGELLATEAQGNGLLFTKLRLCYGLTQTLL